MESRNQSILRTLAQVLEEHKDSPATESSQALLDRLSSAT
jgi:hypothetical protein